MYIDHHDVSELIYIRVDLDYNKRWNWKLCHYVDNYWQLSSNFEVLRWNIFIYITCSLLHFNNVASKPKWNRHSLCLPHEMGRHIVFSSVVCPSVRLSVRHTFVSALYLLNPWWDFQITLHKCQVWWDDVQCLPRFDQGPVKVKVTI